MKEKQLDRVFDKLVKSRIYYPDYLVGANDKHLNISSKLKLFFLPTYQTDLDHCLHIWGAIPIKHFKRKLLLHKSATAAPYLIFALFITSILITAEDLAPIIALTSLLILALLGGLGLIFAIRTKTQYSGLKTSDGKFIFEYKDSYNLLEAKIVAETNRNISLIDLSNCKELYKDCGIELLSATELRFFSKKPFEIYYQAINSLNKEDKDTLYLYLRKAFAHNTKLLNKLCPELFEDLYGYLRPSEKITMPHAAGNLEIVIQK